MSDHDLDRQIDLVARQMTTVAEDATFRARVTTRLPGSQHRRPWFAWTWVRAGAVPVALLAVAAYVAWRVPPVAMERTPTAAPVARDSSPGGGRVGSAPLIAALTAVDSSRTADDRRRAILVEPSVPMLPALTTVPLAPLASIQPEPLSTPLLGVTPIATEPLVLAPLDGGKD